MLEAVGNKQTRDAFADNIRFVKTPFWGGLRARRGHRYLCVPALRSFRPVHSAFSELNRAPGMYLA
jgi:hypothetical protein